MSVEENYAIEYLNAILAEDREVYERLIAVGGDKVNEYYAKQVLEKLRAPRRLDKPVTNIKLNKNGGFESGCKKILISNYEKTEVDHSTEYGDIDFAGTIIVSEVDVVRVLKALYKTGVSRNPEVADAVKSIIFGCIKLGITAGNTLTKELIKERLHADGYYQEQLVAGMWEIFDATSN